MVHATNIRYGLVWWDTCVVSYVETCSHQPQTNLTAFADYVQQHQQQLPAVFWQQTPPQHFVGWQGEYPGGSPPFECRAVPNVTVEGDGSVRALAPEHAIMERVWLGGVGGGGGYVCVGQPHCTRTLACYNRVDGETQQHRIFSVQWGSPLYSRSMSHCHSFTFIGRVWVVFFFCLYVCFLTGVMYGTHLKLCRNKSSKHTHIPPPRDNGAGYECTHYCFPSAQQTWVYALYRAMTLQYRGTVAPPTAAFADAPTIEGRTRGRLLMHGV